MLHEIRIVIIENVVVYAASDTYRNDRVSGGVYCKNVAPKPTKWVIIESVVVYAARDTYSNYRLCGGVCCKRYVS